MSCHIGKLVSFLHVLLLLAYSLSHLFFVFFIIIIIIIIQCNISLSKRFWFDLLSHCGRSFRNTVLFVFVVFYFSLFCRFFGFCYCCCGEQFIFIILKSINGLMNDGDGYIELNIFAPKRG